MWYNYDKFYLIKEKLRMNVYLDNNATTPLDPEAREAMLPFLDEKFGNPNSLHAYGSATHKPLQNALDSLYESLNAANEDDIIITSCATESNNWVMKSIFFDQIFGGERKKIIISGVEHPAIVASAEFLTRFGVEVVKLPVDSNGLCSESDLEAVIDDKTALVSIMWANNETGMIFDVAKFADIAHAYGALFHTDATQAVGKIAVNLKRVDVDLLSFSAHKFHGPKGVGGLFIRKGIELSPLFNGGEHMGGRRSGTLNVAGIVGMGVALTNAVKFMDFENSHVRRLRDKLEDEILTIKDTFVVGERERRVPNTILASIKGVEGEAMLWDLNRAGIGASTGSACASEALESNPIMEAIGADDDLAHTALRLSLSRFNTEAEVDYAANEIKKAAQRLRAISSSYAEN